MMRVSLSQKELFEAWPALTAAERVDGFGLLTREDAEELFGSLASLDQAELLMELPVAQRRVWLRLSAPDDVADLIQETPADERPALLELLDEPTRKEITALMAYAEDEAGGLMNPRFARLRPDISVDEAISYLRRQTYEHVENIYYAYVLDAQQRLLGVVSLRELVAASPLRMVRDVMEEDVVTVPEAMDQEAVSHLFAQHDLMAVPVIDKTGRMKGIVAVDDIVDVVQEEATEDIQKIGGTEALDAPYLHVGLADMLRKRAGWLATLLLAGFLTVKVMRQFQGVLEQAAVLGVFVPLIISSGGNAGSQAATLVVRAMALDEVRLRDWWRVVRQEFLVGLILGGVLGVLGLTTIIVWHFFSNQGFGEHYLMISVTVSVSIVAVALWGTLAGSMLPFLLKSVGADPASASVPVVATLVDMSGVLIYLLTASVLLRGTLF